MIVDRILEIIELKGISKSKFYKETGLSNGFLDKVKDIGVSKIEHILNSYPEINSDWLLTGKGDMIRSELQAYSKIHRLNAGARKVAEPLSIDRGIPLVNVTAIGGFGNSNFAIEQMDVKEYYVIPKFKHKQIDFMIEVEGSSMYPKYNSGDVVACRIINEKNFIQWNKTHVVGTRDQGIIIKRIKRGDDDQKLLMVSDNDQYDPFEVRREDITGVALVVGVIRLE
jgi:phage repressor protein C with HTH and peptisase S24 domain